MYCFTSEIIRCTTIQYNKFFSTVSKSKLLHQMKIWPQVNLWWIFMPTAKTFSEWQTILFLIWDVSWTVNINCNHLTGITRSINHNSLLTFYCLVSFCIFCCVKFCLWRDGAAMAWYVIIKWPDCVAYVWPPEEKFSQYHECFWSLCIETVASAVASFAVYDFDSIECPENL